MQFVGHVGQVRESERKADFQLCGRNARRLFAPTPKNQFHEAFLLSDLRLAVCNQDQLRESFQR
jgi:hypothetical protein